MPRKRFRMTLSLKISVSLLLAVLFAAPALAQERACVDAKIANLRSGPGTDNQILWQVERYHPIILVQKKGNWYQIKDFEGEEGWIHQSLVW